jgi:hypothetical protein
VKLTGEFTTGFEGDTVKLVVSPGGVDVPKISAIVTAAASFAARVDRAQLFSIRCRIENSSYTLLDETKPCLTIPGL